MPAQLNFKEIAETVDVVAVADWLGLKMKNNRAACPACNSNSSNSLELLPETNSFRCHAAAPKPGNKVFAGDCIGLYAHLSGYAGMYRAAKELQDHFGAPRQTAPVTTPQKEKAGANPPAPSKQAAFDAEAFAAKLAYSEEVEALGITESEAKELGIGMYRGRIYSALRYPSGVVAGFQYSEGEIALPKSLLPDTAPNVVAFPKRA